MHSKKSFVAIISFVINSQKQPVFFTNEMHFATILKLKFLCKTPYLKALGLGEIKFIDKPSLPRNQYWFMPSFIFWTRAGLYYNHWNVSDEKYLILRKLATWINQSYVVGCCYCQLFACSFFHRLCKNKTWQKHNGKAPSLGLKMHIQSLIRPCH